MSLLSQWSLANDMLSIDFSLVGTSVNSSYAMKVCFLTFEPSENPVRSFPFIFLQDTGCSTDAHQLWGQKFRCCGTAPVEHFAVYFGTDGHLRIRATSEGTFIQSLKITAHCDVRFVAPYKYPYLPTYLLT